MGRVAGMAGNSKLPLIIDNCKGRTRGRCRVYWRSGPDELWQGGYAPVKLSRIRDAMAANEARGAWKYAEYKIEPVELSEEQRARLAELRERVVKGG